MKKIKYVIAAIPIVLMMVSATPAFAWDNGYGPGGGGYPYQGPGSGSGLLNSLSSFGGGCGAFCAGQQDASYDQNNGLVYNPTGSCIPCHSQDYWNNFRQGYDSVYQNQQQNQNSEQKSTNNIYINGNNNYVSTNTEETSNQEQQQQQNSFPSGPSGCGFLCGGPGCGFGSCGVGVGGFEP